MVTNMTAVIAEIKRRLEHKKKKYAETDDTVLRLCHMNYIHGLEYALSEIEGETND